MSGRPNQPTPAPGDPTRKPAFGDPGRAGKSDATTGNLLAELSGGDAAPAAAAPPPRFRRRLKTQNFVIGAVIVVSIGALYAMRLYGMGAGITFQTVPIDYQLEKSAARLTAEQRRILNDLQLSGTPIRIAMGHLRKNPFHLDSEAGEVIGPRPGPILDPGDKAAELERVIASSFARLELHGVMNGKIPIARINGKTVRVGDTVESTFVIKAIHDRTVELEATNGKVYALTIGEAPNDGP